jgi:hypothetical protein
MRLFWQVTAMYISAAAVVCALFLSQTHASGDKQATISAEPTVEPVPYRHLDFSRAVNPQYDLYMNMIESLTPRTVSKYMFQEKRLSTVQVKPAPEPAHEASKTGKLVLTIIASLVAAFLILWYAVRRKVTLT